VKNLKGHLREGEMAAGRWRGTGSGRNRGPSKRKSPTQKSSQNRVQRKARGIGGREYGNGLYKKIFVRRKGFREIRKHWEK